MGPLKDKANSCKVCGCICTQHCSACNKVSYCSKEHQKEDWKSHKSECFPATIAQNNLVGRYLEATRNIRQGELILKEKALITGPNSGSSTSSTMHYYPLCLSCYRIVRSNYKCSNCKWPLCGLQCQMMRNHSANECQIFAERGVAPFYPHETHLYEKIIILRGLLCKETDPETWVKLQDLESHSTERKGTVKGLLLTKSAEEFVHETCGLSQFTSAEIDHIVGVLGTNAFWNNDNNVGSATVFRSGSFLYYFGSFPAHNCTPNSSWTIQMNSEFYLRASVDIPCGESITQLYTEATLGTLERRAHLKDTKYFDCSCPRCSDPTELNIHFSSVKCRECEHGYLLPVNPLNIESGWRCLSIVVDTGSDSKFCGKTVSVTTIDKITLLIRSEIMLANVCSNEDNADSCFQCIDSLNQLLTKYQSKILHHNHYLVYEIENLIIQRLSYLFALPAIVKAKKYILKLTELAQLMTDLTRKCLTITNVILPGLSTQRGRLEFNNANVFNCQESVQQH